MAKFFDRTAKTAPSQYPKLLFHGVRCFQLLASVIVGGITAYFVWHLTNDDQKVPWTFIWVRNDMPTSIIPDTELTVPSYCPHRLLQW